MDKFSEMIDMLRGMRGHMVQASIFLPGDDGRFPMAAFGGTLHDVEFKERSLDPRWVLS